MIQIKRNIIVLKHFIYGRYLLQFCIFSGKGDFESTKIFLDCIKASYLPKITIAKNKNITKICIIIDEKELNERKSSKNTFK